MLWFYRFICGYVLIALKGNYCERIINALAQKGVSVWHIRRKKGGVQLCIFARDFKRLPQFVGKSGVNIHIINKVGWPFVVKKYKRRPGIAVGCVLFFALIFLLSGYVWNIKVEGNDKVDSKTIIDACRQIGVYEGVKAKSINPQDARVELLIKVKGLSWASINIEGSCVTVNVREYENPDKDKMPCNLISTASGVVVSTKVTQGDVCVKVGDTVTKGQLLVSGAVEHADGSTEFVKSEGEVVVETVRNFESKVDFLQSHTVRNGKVKTLRVLNFFGLKVPMFLGDVKGPFEKEVIESKFYVNKNYAPIYITKARFYITETDNYEFDEEQAKSKAQKSIEEQTLKLKGFKVLSYKDFFIRTEKGILLKREYLCQENATKPEILLIDTFN